MTLTTLWGPLVGLVLPLVVGLLLKCSWPEWVKALVALAVSAAVGIGDLASTGQLDWSLGAIGVIALVYIASQATFFGLVRQLPKLQAWLECNTWWALIKRVFRAFVQTPQ